MAQLVKRINIALESVKKQFGNPDVMTYYPQEPRKSNMQIYMDNIRWLLKHGHLNKHYYYYGLDRRNSPDQNTLMSEKLFDSFRDTVNEYGRIGKYKINYICVLRDKFLFGQYLRSLGIAVPKIYALCDKDSMHWIDPPANEPLSGLLKRDGLDCFLKGLVSEIGRDIYPVKVENGKLCLARKESTIEELSRVIHGKCILQERLTQHPDLERIYPHSVNTMRVVTVLYKDTVEMLGIVLRLGAKGSYCDNWGLGGLALGVDWETGKCMPQGVYDPRHGKFAQRHPDTGAVFEGFEVPFFKEAIELSKQLHTYFYGIHSIGWDIAITKNGPVCIEGNENWGMPIMQIFNTNLLKRYFETLT